MGLHRCVLDHVAGGVERSCVPLSSLVRGHNKNSKFFKNVFFMELLVDAEFLRRLSLCMVPCPDVETALHGSFEALFPQCGKKAKHKRQESSLVNHASSFDTITDVVEFGCGVAGFSAHFCLANNQNRNLVRFHLLDRQSFRSNVRQDKVIRREGRAVNRITKDVLDFSVKEILVQDQKQVFLFATKHFCGFATDVLIDRFRELRREAEVKLCVAPCCHGLIRKELFAGDCAWIEKELGLNFELLVRVSGWATMNDLENPTVCAQTGLTRAQKQALGLKAKLIFDTARCRSLENVRLVRYTTESVECNLLVSKV
jgi:hypothetical protein